MLSRIEGLYEAAEEVDTDSVYVNLDRPRERERGNTGGTFEGIRRSREAEQ